MCFPKAAKITNTTLMYYLRFHYNYQCIHHHPCDPLAKCVNEAPGFRCEPCPDGFDGLHANGYYAQSITQEYNNQICKGGL